MKLRFAQIITAIVPIFISGRVFAINPPPLKPDVSGVTQFFCDFIEAKVFYFFSFSGISILIDFSD
jgi:hypothetical protein